MRSIVLVLWLLFVADATAFDLRDKIKNDIAYAYALAWPCAKYYQPDHDSIAVLARVNGIKLSRGTPEGEQIDEIAYSHIDTLADIFESESGYGTLVECLAARKKFPGAPIIWDPIKWDPPLSKKPLGKQ